MITYISKPAEDPSLPGTFSGTVEIQGKPANVSFDADNLSATDFERILGCFCTTAPALLSRAMKAISVELLDTYNDGWRCYTNGHGQEFERPLLDEKGFIAMLTLHEISISPTKIEIIYEDGDLFFGHWVTATAEYSINKNGVEFKEIFAAIDG